MEKDIYDDLSQEELDELRGWDDEDEDEEEDTSVDCDFEDMQDYIDYKFG